MIILTLCVHVYAGPKPNQGIMLTGAIRLLLGCCDHSMAPFFFFVIDLFWMVWAIISLWTSTSQVGIDHLIIYLIFWPLDHYNIFFHFASFSLQSDWIVCSLTSSQGAFRIDALSPCCVDPQIVWMESLTFVYHCMFVFHVLCIIAWCILIVVTTYSFQGSPLFILKKLSAPVKHVEVNSTPIWVSPL